MENQVEIVFWDVQHGHSTYIRTPNGKHLVIDLGIGSKKDEKFSPILHLKNKYKINTLDLVTITHPHKDHMDDLLNLHHIDVKVFTRPFHLKQSDILTERILDSDLGLFRTYLSLTDYYSTPLLPNSNSNYREADKLGGLEVLEFIPKNSSTGNLNNHSVVSVLSYASTKVVIPGDNEDSSLRELLEQPEFYNAIKDADVLLAPHHGRMKGYYPDFVKTVNPRITIISDSSLKDTSARYKYTIDSRGWHVYYNNGNSEVRKTLSTYNDGVIIVKFGHGDKNPFLNIRTKQIK
jgi:beta-lactamase superfamily II metal-dependent hydrolase